MPTFRHGRTVTLNVRTRTGEDDYGNDVFTVTSQDVDNCPVWPRVNATFQGGTEVVQGERDTVYAGVATVIPASINVDGVADELHPKVIDSVTIGGVTYEVDADPGDYTQSPLTGHGIGWMLNLKKVTG